MSKPNRQQLLGVLLVSMGALALEIILTRVFSVTMWYHFAFLAISLALMGSAAAGVLLYFLPQLTETTTARRWIANLTTLLAVAIPIIFLTYLQIPFEPVLMNRESWFGGGQLGWLILIFVILSLPFFLSGMIISLALSAWSEDAGRVYAADLVGASLGCLFSIAALEYLGGTGAVLAVSVLLAAAGVVLVQGGGRQTAVSLIGLVVLLLAFGWQLWQPWLAITVNKAGGVEPTPVYEKWNAHSRVTVYEPVGYPFFWTVSPEKWEQTIADDSSLHHALLLIDAVAGTPIQSFDGDLNKVKFLRYDLTALAYHLVNAPNTLVIGPGGGRDVLSALVSGAPHVTAVEVNPAIVNAVRGPFADFAGHLYERPDVTVAIADARGYIDRSPEQYDVIQASLIDTWAAGGSGAFALSENSLYTQEAFTTYFNHLSDRGVLTVSRWYLPNRPAETLRLVSTGMAGWEDGGVADPRQHIVVVAHNTSGAQTEGLSTSLFKKRPFTPEEITRLQTAVADLGYQILYAPGLDTFEAVGDFIAADDRQAVIDSYPLDISPATDNRPFFFNLVLIGDLFDPALSGSGVYRTSMEAILILFAVIGITVLLGALFILVPLWLGTRRGGLQRPSPRLLGYFAMLGIGFMMVEIPTIQKLTVYLGRPVYSLAVVLFSLLLFSGLGSFWSNGWDDQTRRRLVARLFPALVGVTLLHMLFAGTLLAMTLAFGLTVRIIMAVLLLAPLGFLLGIPFPTGIRWAGQNRPGVIPWLWGINGVMSVLGSALATLFAIHIGFRLTLLLAALVYVAAGWLFMAELGVKWRGEETAVSASQTPQTSV